MFIDYELNLRFYNIVNTLPTICKSKLSIEMN